MAMLAGCAEQRPTAAPASLSVPTSSRAPGAAVNPGNIRRIGRELPAGYEVSNVARAASPKAIWGLGADTVANPPLCMVLADPGDAHQPAAQGVSGSGPGGIVDSVVVTMSGGLATLDRNAQTACAHWDLTAGRTLVNVGLIEAPHIDGADTLGMVADIRAAVESGSEIDSRAYTFVAYLGAYYVLTALTTDPGSMLPPLPPQYAADLLVKTVSTLRG
ncbi:hypothetical protein Mkiyose1665_55990 [Mycobacterium kiyosense]|uniref:DUF5642 domain-containing protein n=1 Tax=Mycobacterium kiyosense TaxID=2871094 RepID=A0A9P3Q6F9_9MYCO|nr:hypothetical protein IWGMT90018_51860 [Mycobacterium kiyosense]BDE16236.1 hypothetical protein MKCMC460_50960 [Mycobacterium sp. 20KCMC460]GLB86060.1 hypothetical protein SRL2020028_53160 [Mycobacterium kiyosense]GLB92777.1 hypothetical protein SRL2020130_55940 [Mycobacterium kiyosense]GLB98692.1 hypothetical protein SRL2020226_54680 [Mycobacterium kiyosense]